MPSGSGTRSRVAERCGSFGDGRSWCIASRPDWSADWFGMTTRISSGAADSGGSAGSTMTSSWCSSTDRERRRAPVQSSDLSDQQGRVEFQPEHPLARSGGGVIGCGFVAGQCDASADELRGLCRSDSDWKAQRPFERVVRGSRLVTEACAQAVAGLNFGREIRRLRLRVDGVEKDELRLRAVA